MAHRKFGHQFGGMIAALALLSGASIVSAQESSEPPEGPVEGEEGEIFILDDNRGAFRRAPNGNQNRPAPDGNQANTPSNGSSSGSAPTILAILAHPDDEITIAPVLARVAREGGEVTLVFATSGDAGPGVSGLEPGAELAALRESEARCAAFALGLPEPIFWQLGDGALSRLARAPDSAANDLAARIASLIDIEKPGIIMTWGPDGGYGHADHRMVSNAVSQVVQNMGDNRPDLLYSAIPSGDQPALPGFENWATLHPSLITDRIRYQLPDLAAVRIAIDCYASQFDETARTYLPDALHRNVWNGTVYFRLAFPRGM